MTTLLTNDATGEQSHGFPSGWLAGSLSVIARRHRVMPCARGHTSPGGQRPPAGPVGTILSAWRRNPSRLGPTGHPESVLKRMAALNNLGIDHAPSALQTGVMGTNVKSPTNFPVPVLADSLSPEAVFRLTTAKRERARSPLEVGPEHPQGSTLAAGN